MLNKKITLLSFFLLVVFLFSPIAGVMALPSWSAYSYHTVSNKDMTNAPSSDVLVPAGNNVLSIFKAIDPTDPLQIKTFDQSGALLATLNITVNSTADDAASTCVFRVAPYNSTDILIGLAYLATVNPESYTGYPAGYISTNLYVRIMTILTDGITYQILTNETAIAANYTQYTFGSTSFSGFGISSCAFMSNIVNDSNGNYYACLCTMSDQIVGGSYNSHVSAYLLINLATGSTYQVANGEPSSSYYYGLPVLYYAPEYTGTPPAENGQGTIWIVASGLMVAFNPLSATLTDVNIHTVTYTPWLMNKPMDCWINNICTDAASSAMASCYFEDVFTINSSSIHFDSNAYYNVSTSVTTTIHRGWSWGVVAGVLAIFGGGFYWDTSPYIPPDTITYTNITASVSYFNTFSENLEGQGLIAVWSEDLSAFRCEFMTITSLATYTQYMIDVNGSGATTAGQILATTSMPLATVEAALTGAYAVRYSNSSTYERVSNDGLWFTPPWNSTYGIGYFAGSPQTVVIAQADTRMTINNYPPIYYYVPVLTDYNVSANPIEMIVDKPIAVPDSADPMVEVAFACASNLPLNWAIYVSQTNDSVISSGNKLVAIDTGSLPANFSGWVIKKDWQDGIANHTLAVGFYPSSGTDWNFSEAVALQEPWWAQYGAFDLSYINVTSLSTQISGMTNLQNATAIANLTGGVGYYLYYSYLGVPTANGSGYVGGGNYTGFNWTFYFGNITLTTRNVTTPQESDAITSLFGQLAALTGVNVLALGMIVALLTILGVSLVVAYCDKNKSIPSMVYVVTVLFIIAIFTYVSVLPTYILLTIFALIIAAAAIGVASFFSGHGLGGGGASEGGDR